MLEGHQIKEDKMPKLKSEGMYEVEIETKYEGSICICCMATDNLSELFCTNDEFNENYAAMLKTCFNIKISETDGHNFICENCIEQLENSAKFKRQIKNSISILTNYDKKTLKKENDDDDDDSETDPLFLHELRDLKSQESDSDESVQEKEVNENKPSIHAWTDKSTLLLLTLYEDYESEFQDGIKKRKVIWDEVAAQMKRKGYKLSASQCQTKFNSMKRNYKRIINHKNTERERKAWRHFERMNDIFGSTSLVRPKTEPSSSTQEAVCSAKENRMKRLESVLDDALKRASEEAKRRRMDRDEEKSKKMELLMAQKERHHKEQMDLLDML